MTTPRPTEPDEAPATAALPRPAIAISSIILSMSLIAIGNGLMFAFIPVRLAERGFSPFEAGLVVTALSLGGMAGCLITGALVKRVAHARAFMTLSALVILSNAMIAVRVDLPLWMLARALYGFGINGLFIVAQSWLNDVVENRVRGRISALFYMAYDVSLGLGALMLSAVGREPGTVPTIGIAFAALAILPVGMTRLRTPPPPATAAVAVKSAWRISPVGLVSMLVVGGLTMMITGFVPIYATDHGFSRTDVSLVMSAMPLGMIFVQLPLGWLSDRTDRRYVLIAAAFLVACGGFLASRMEGASLVLFILVFLVWSGANESIYSVASAHANDRAASHELVALSSTMLFAWSLSGFVLPGLATVLTEAFGTRAFMVLTSATAAAYGAFVLWRTLRGNPVKETGEWQPAAAPTPLAPDLAFPGHPHADPGPQDGEG